ncbi:GNAT family N-acetyltransferase [Liquorilactobacillus cacaonum]|uniref:GNAT family acetyltransferase n=1 Tax=Liquorilactobacillus cacaonum DSM 21116 TaxID=1423729 RepID=A0A0R2CKH0_9LACO|nr:GNAT family N-acetyltransferase [Liquorilactobacillus cacaonum]KRM92110.1 GNAT family acetyltransferase [Liquorilactobacillus cacaonum DSM 21116]
MHLRIIKSEDNQAIKEIIQTTLKEFGNDIPGTAFFDPQLDTLAEFYNSQPKKARYWVIEDNNKVLGGGGLAPFAQPGVTELQKLYFTPETRGHGLGTKLIHLIEKEAKKMHYNQIYIETFKNQSSAVHLYEKFGYTELTAPLQGSEHSACDMWFIKKI